MVWDNFRPRSTLDAGCVSVVLAIPLCLTMWYAFGSSVGLSSWLCSVVVMTVAVGRWNSRRQFWFWLATALSFALQVPLLRLVPWEGHHIFGITLVAPLLADYWIVTGIFTGARKVLSKRP